MPAFKKAVGGAMPQSRGSANDVLAVREGAQRAVSGLSGPD